MNVFSSNYKHTTSIPHVFHSRFHVVSTWNTRGVFVDQLYRPFDGFYKCMAMFHHDVWQSESIYLLNHPTNTPRVFHVKKTWKPPLHVILTWNTRGVFAGHSFLNLRSTTFSLPKRLQGSANEFG